MLWCLWQPWNDQRPAKCTCSFVVADSKLVQNPNAKYPISRTPSIMLIDSSLQQPIEGITADFLDALCNINFHHSTESRVQRLRWAWLPLRWRQIEWHPWRHSTVQEKCRSNVLFPFSLWWWEFLFPDGDPILVLHCSSQTGVGWGRIQSYIRISTIYSSMDLGIVFAQYPGLLYGRTPSWHWIEHFGDSFFDKLPSCAWRMFKLTVCPLFCVIEWEAPNEHSVC